MTTPFPRDYGGFPLGAAIAEAASGFFKGKLKNKIVFWVFLAIEMGCAAVLLTELFMTAFQTSYSEFEVMAAIFAFVFAGFLLVSEAWMMWNNLEKGGRRACLASLCASFWVGSCLLLSGLPMFLAIRYREIPMVPF